MGLIKEFKKFAMRGNVVDMAVGIIIGAAFGKIVSSIVNDVIMPPIGLLLGGVNFTDLKIIIKEGSTDSAGAVVEAVSLNYGTFLQTVIDFVIIAFVIFMLIRVMNRFKKKEEEKPAEAPVPTAQEVLLTEIRDILKNK
jgi:large conductance mechanosensitive channel